VSDAPNSGASELHILLVDDNRERAELVGRRLKEVGFGRLSLVHQNQRLLSLIERNPPDVIVISLESPGRDLLESLSIVSHHNPTPIVMFTREDDPAFIGEAVNAGVTTYLVDGIDADKVKPVVDVAIAQFRAFQHLKGELASTRTELAERRLIERAKLLLMERDGFTEAQAHQRLQAVAMEKNLRLAELAARIIELADQRSAPGRRDRGVG